MVFQKFFLIAMRFWPGFQKLWFKGDLHSLLVAVLFGWVLTLAWLATFVWPEWLPTILGTSWIASFLFAGLWISIGCASLAALLQPVLRNDPAQPNSNERQRHLVMAQELYLQADYFEAERLVRKNVSGEVEDVESALLWIAILRRTRRLPQALEMIAWLEKLDAAIGWAQELRAEKDQCLRLKIQTPPAHA